MGLQTSLSLVCREFSILPYLGAQTLLNVGHTTLLLAFFLCTSLSACAPIQARRVTVELDRPVVQTRQGKVKRVPPGWLKRPVIVPAKSKPVKLKGRRR